MKVTLLEYLKIKRDLYKSNRDNEEAIDKAVAKKNNIVKIGDIIEDHYQKIKVERIVHGYTNYRGGLPYSMYYGHGINKDGTKSRLKNMQKINVYGCNLEKVNGKEVESLN